jgi:hypothetical protein
VTSARFGSVGVMSIQALSATSSRSTQSMNGETLRDAIGGGLSAKLLLRRRRALDFLGKESAVAPMATNALIDR